MSSKEEPPRKKVKHESASSRTLRSQTAIENESQESSRPEQAKHKNTPSERQRRAMSDSRRRSSRKNRQAELKDNEQHIVDSTSPKASSTRKQSAMTGVVPQTPSSRKYKDESQDVIEDDAEFDDEFIDDEEMDDVDGAADHSENARSLPNRPSRFDSMSLAAMANLLGTSQNNNLKSLLNALRQPDPSIQLIALNELVNLLSMSTEESLAGYGQIDALVVELVNIMRGPDCFGEDNPEMMLLACRCLANLMEAMPSATANIAYSGAVPVLCQKLLEIEFIDLAEQSLSTLEKISKDYPGTVVREGGMAACLTYLDFFSTNVQRIAVVTAANCAKNVPRDCFAMVRDVTPTLQHIITGSDSKVVEAGCLCLTRVLESFRHNDAQLEQLLLPDLLLPILTVISPTQVSNVGVPEYIKTRLLHILAIAARCSEQFAARLLMDDIIGILYQLLTGLSKPQNSEEIKANSVVVLQALINRPRDQVTEVIVLITEILPGLPDIELFSGLSTKDRGSDDSRSSTWEQKCPRQFEEFVTIVLPTLMDMFNSTVNISLRRLSLLALLKICYNLNTEVLKRVVSDVPLAVFITGVLGTAELDLVLSGVRLASILLKRVPDIYAHKLRTEGCVAEVHRLVENYSDTQTSKNPATHDAGTSEDSRGQNSSYATEKHRDEDIVEPGTHDKFAVRPSEEVDDEIVVEDDDDVNNDDNEDDDDDEVEDDDDDEDGDDDHHEDDDDYDDVETDDDEDVVVHEDGDEDDLATNVASLALPNESASDILATTKKLTLARIGYWASKFADTYAEIAVKEDTQDEVRSLLVQLGHDLQNNCTIATFEALAEAFKRTSEISSYLLKSTGVLTALVFSLTQQNADVNKIRFLRAFKDGTALTTLVTKLQELLTWSEKFDLVTTSTNEEKRSPSILARQIRLKLVADDAADIPRPFRTLMVSIHAIATFKALDEYLRPRLQASSLIGSGRPSRSSTPTSGGSAGGLLSRAPEGLQGVFNQLASASTSLPESIRERLAGLDPSALLGVHDRSEAGRSSDVQERLHTLQDNATDEEEDSGPAVSVEVSASTGKAIARNADGQQIPTPRTNTPQGTSGKHTTASRHTASKSPMSYAAALAAAPKDWHIQFQIADKIISHDTTVFGAINNIQPVGDASVYGRSGMSLYEIAFRKVAGPAPPPSGPSFDAPLAKDSPDFLEPQSGAGLILRLLDLLHSLHINWRDYLAAAEDCTVQQLAATAFVSTKLTAKLNRQLEEPLIVASQCLPAWARDLPRCFPFLFPFETRYLFLQSTSFGYSRSMARWQAAAKKDRDDSQSFLGRLQRQKVRISRPRMLESAMKVMELYGASPAVLEVEYFEEVGTGLGPTLEFYSTVSRDIAKKRLNLWRDQDSSQKSEFVFASSGLFPQPLSDVDNEVNSAAAKKILPLFRTIGIFLARAMLDSRLVDISFSPLFFRLLDGKDDLPKNIGTISELDKDLARSLRLIEKFADAHKEALASSDVMDDELEQLNKSITIDNVSIVDLGLDFTYPGRPDLEMIPDGQNVEVRLENVSMYLERVIDLTLGSGISRQCTAFKNGFSQVFPYDALRAFTPVELTMLFGRAAEDWSKENLAENIKADHGFTMDSSTVRNLISVLSSMNEVDRRGFLQFITGSPKLPIGGFKSLTPQLTVVCKPHEAPLTANDYLPSVMTCVNYLKLPDYSDVDVLKARLLTAMREGGGSFHLS